MPTPTRGEGCATYPCVIYATVRGMILAIARTMPYLPYAVRLRPLPRRITLMPLFMRGNLGLTRASKRGRPAPTRRTWMLPNLGMLPKGNTLFLTMA